MMDNNFKPTWKPVVKCTHQAARLIRTMTRCVGVFFRWQTFIGAVLLLLSGKLGWVEISRIPRYSSWFIPSKQALSTP